MVDAVECGPKLVVGEAHQLGDVLLFQDHRPHPVDDEALDAILITGTLTADEDEPLDIREIDEEERKFWSESWDEPEEW